MWWTEFTVLFKRMLPRHLEICVAIDNIDNLIRVIILLQWLILFCINDWYPVFLRD